MGATFSPGDTLRDPERLAAVRRLQLLGSPPEEAFDRLTRLAGAALGVPMAIVNLVEEDRQFLKSCFGLPPHLREVPVSYGLCAQVVVAREPLFIADVLTHPLRDNPAVPDLNIRAYAGVPLITREGHSIGTFCVLDSEPREWTAEDQTLLHHLAASAMTEIELRAEIAERGRAERALRDREERLRIALAASDTGTFRWDPSSGEYLEFDENLRRLFGFSPDEPVQVTDDTIARVHPDDVSELIAAVDRSREGADFDMEYRIILPDGTVRWLYDRAKMEHDEAGRPTYLVGACTDITQRKQAEEALRASAKSFRTMAESMPQKIFTARPNGDVDYFNPQWTEFTGLPFEQIRDWGWTQFIHPDDVEENVRRWRHSIVTGEPFEFEHRFRRADGVYRWHLSRAHAVRDAGGAIHMWVGSNTDIDDQKRAEEELQRSHDHLRMALTVARMVAWEWNPTEDIITVSGNLADIYGVTDLNASAQGFPLVHPDDRERHEAAVRAAVETASPYASTFRIIRPDMGDVVWLEERGAPLLDSASILEKVIGITVDITARVRAEAELRQQAELLALAHDAIIVRDRAGRILFWNAGATELYGWSADEAVGRVTHDLLQTRVIPSNLPGTEVDAALAARGVWEGSLEHTRRDGTHVVVESRQLLARGSDGAPDAVLEVNRDATARESLARLQRVTAELSAAVRVDQIAEIIVNEGIAALGAQVGVIALLSQDGASFTTVRTAGYAPEVVAAWPSFAADAPLPISDAVRTREVLILESLEERQVRYPHLTPVQPVSEDGALVAIPLLVGERAVGGLGLSFGTARRFTPEERAALRTLGDLCAQALERARLYEAEHLARAEAEATLGQIADGVVIAGADGRITFVNEVGQTLLGVNTTGVPPEEHSAAYGLLTPEGVPFALEDLPLVRALRTARTVSDVDIRVRRRDGTEAMVQVNAAPVLGEDGTVAGAVATFRDVTAARELEREKEVFLSAAAHDLKNPVAILQGQAQLLRRRVQRGPLEYDRVLEGLNVIESRSRMMTRLIDDLMDSTRMRMGQPLQLDRQPSDLAEIVRDAVAAQQAVAEDRQLSFQRSDGDFVGCWDAARLARVLGNLLNNAVKFSPAGSEILVSLRREVIEGQAWAVVAVRDRGIGIPAEDLPHVFDWFYRGRNVQDTVSGTGIGLAGSCQIVQQHGGTIEVESQEGIGSTFTVRLPIEHPGETP